LIKTPAVYVVDSEFAGASLKHNAQFKKKRHRGPCVVQVIPTPRLMEAAKELSRLFMLGAIVLRAGAKRVIGIGPERRPAGQKIRKDIQ
jgi:hypothetical protein